MTRILLISLIITALHVCTWEGMIFFKPANKVGDWLDRLNAGVLRKPLFECLTCMGGMWTAIIYPILYGIDWWLIPTIPAVIGLNTIIAKYLSHD